MAKKAETKFAEKVDKELAELGGVWFNIQQQVTRGTPDRIGCLSGVFVALELKSQGGKVQSLQRFFINQITKEKGYATVVSPDNWPNVYEDLVIIRDGGDHAPAGGAA